ncbi:glycoside hydrolase family 113 [Ekhidna sp.]|uniref:glycoside hydrolase family 113 n=1 Tax=Ekhidna sp. TaxID=2608089 RepID=UPI003C7B80A6
MRLLVLFSLLVLGVVAMVLLPVEDNIRINGASLVNPPREITSEKMGEVKRINADWVALIPYAFSRDNEPNVSFDHSRQWWGEHTDGNCRLIQYAKDHGFKVMVKPHVWARGAGWVGDFNLDTEDKWMIWEADYTKYILNHAIKADSMGVELFCIGTEYRIPARERPAFWRSLIKQVRGVYSGKITYASNWDNYQNITWWDQVDYIGIDAYFPLAEGIHPDLSEIRKGWDPIKQQLSLFSKKWGKPILFTEYGFQSANGAAGSHWEVDQSESSANPQLQADAYEATFEALENEQWWVGGFFWKWHFNTLPGGRWRGTEWTPQNKPAEAVIARWYGKKAN